MSPAGNSVGVHWGWVSPARNNVGVQQRRCQHCNRSHLGMGITHPQQRRCQCRNRYRPGGRYPPPTRVSPAAHKGVTHPLATAHKGISRSLAATAHKGISHSLAAHMTRSLAAYMTPSLATHITRALIRNWVPRGRATVCTGGGYHPPARRITRSLAYHPCAHSQLGSSRPRPRNGLGRLQRCSPASARFCSMGSRNRICSLGVGHAYEAAVG